MKKPPKPAFSVEEVAAAFGVDVGQVMERGQIVSGLAELNSRTEDFARATIASMLSMEKFAVVTGAMTDVFERRAKLLRQMRAKARGRNWRRVR